MKARLHPQLGDHRSCGRLRDIAVLRCLGGVLILIMPMLGTFCKREEPPKPAEPPAYSKSDYTKSAPADDQPPITFADVTRSSGLSFTHHNGAFGQKWMPETMGSGGGFLDVDNDGHTDIFLVNGSDWPGHEKADTKPTVKLFRNRGDATFEDVTEKAGLAVSCYGMGCTFGDYDGDGDLDIFVTAVGKNLLFRNDAGHFADMAEQAGVRGNDSTTASFWSTGATWVDVDRDGRLDLFVAHYVKWTPETDLFTTFDGKHKGYATPQQYPGQSCRLYRNLDGQRFEDATVKSGVFNDSGKTLGVVVADFNNDEWPDLFVANDTQPNFLYLNKGDGTFFDIAPSAGCGFDDTGRARAGMGVDVADLNNDGTPTIAIGNFTGEPVSLYSRIARGLFQDVAGNMRLATPTLPCLTFGLVFADFDLDGFVDLALANGHIEPEINSVQKEITFAQRPQLFWNNRRRAFVDMTEAAGAPFAEPVVGRGLAVADFDNDGDVDLLLTVNGGPAKLLRNDTPPAKDRRWVKLKLVGDDKNRFAIGATITAVSGDLVQRRTVRASSSYLSQSDTTVVLGLGSRDQIDRLTVAWPDGKTSMHGPLKAEITHTVDRPR
ncbi:MAG: CRTAC1 family protein [Planctomycetota bacterium]